MTDTSTAAAGGNTAGNQAAEELATGLKALWRFIKALPIWFALSLIPWTLASMFYWSFQASIALSGFTFVLGSSTFGVDYGSWKYLIIPLGCIIGCLVARSGLNVRCQQYVRRGPKPLRHYVK